MVNIVLVPHSSHREFVVEVFRCDDTRHQTLVITEKRETDCSEDRDHPDQPVAGSAHIPDDVLVVGHGAVIELVDVFLRGVDGVLLGPGFDGIDSGVSPREVGCRRRYDVVSLFTFENHFEVGEFEVSGRELSEASRSLYYIP